MVIIMSLKRLICFFKGHEPRNLNVKNTKLIELYKNRKKSELFINTITSLNIYNGTVHAASINSNGHYNQTMNNPQLIIGDGAFNHKLSICKRCNNIFYNREPNKETICNSNAFPELENLKLYAEALQWQQEVHKENPELEKAYNSYLMLLKLKATGK